MQANGIANVCHISLVLFGLTLSWLYVKWVLKLMLSSHADCTRIRHDEKSCQILELIENKEKNYLYLSHTHTDRHTHIHTHTVSVTHHKHKLHSLKSIIIQSANNNRPNHLLPWMFVIFSFSLPVNH